MASDPFGTRSTLKNAHGVFVVHRLEALARSGVAPGLDRVPFSIKVLLESVVRHVDGELVTENDVKNLAAWSAAAPKDVELPYMPARVILQDFTGVPAVVDLASMRGAVKKLGADPSRINPLVPVDLVVDHSVQVDYFASPEALAKNAALEFERNRERYEFLRWGQKAFHNFRVVPPATGIVHQVNLEFLAKGVLTKKTPSGETEAFPDTLVGTDSHTTMINGLGVLGWGVGGIEAEAVMLGQPLYMVTPQVVGFRITGKLREGVTATDLVLTVTQMLRKKGVVEKFVEFFGPGLGQMTLADRATIANMAPEYGATCGFFPVDDETLAYLRRTGRTAAEVDLVEAYCKDQGLFRSAGSPDPVFTDTLELDLSAVEPSLAGPKRPQDRVPLSKMKDAFRQSLTAPVKERGFGLSAADLGRKASVEFRGTGELTHGSVVIAAITSCTNTSNPSVMLGAGLLARKAVERGLSVPGYVKTSLAPGSKVVTEYLDKSGLTDDLDTLGFNLVGYGCTTCIGNSGPLPPPVSKAVHDGQLVVSAVLSGNRNFEGRVNPDVKANYLASPPLVVAYALAGTTDIDLSSDPVGKDRSGKPVMLSEIWPSQKEVEALEADINGDMFTASYGNVFDGNLEWNAIKVPEGDLFAFDESSTYIQNPPFFQGLTLEPKPLSDIVAARILAILGDSVTTDHISPAGDIALSSPAGRFLVEKGLQKKDFNSYGSRRGNDRVMVRGTFANIRLKNLMVPGVEGGVTIHVPSSEELPIYDAAERYRAEGTPLVVLAGKEYGSGSSRDWAAKGTLLLGVRAVIAESYERIHRSNLVGMGVLPLQFKAGQNAEALGLTGREELTIRGIAGDIKPRQDVTVEVQKPDGSSASFVVTARLDTPVDINYYRNGGILHTVLRKMLKE